MRQKKIKRKEIVTSYRLLKKETLKPHDSIIILLKCLKFTDFFRNTELNVSIFFDLNKKYSFITKNIVVLR